MFSVPENNIAQFGLREGDHVADLGAGSGFYAAAAGRAVGSSGVVYAVEVQKNMLDRLAKEMQEKGLSNVKVVWGDIEHPTGTRLRERSMDAALVCNILFQLHDRQGFIDELKRILKPKGRVLVVDWYESFGNLGPAPEAVVTVQQAKDMFSSNGFQLQKDLEAGEHHYGFIAALAD